jgi:hypothetical protein
MKKLILSALITIFACVLMAGGCTHGKEGSKDGGCCSWMKDAKFEAVNLDNGAKLTVTTEKADAVKAIQEHFAMIAKGACPHGKDDAKGGCMHGKDAAKDAGKDKEAVKGKDMDCCAWMKDAKIQAVNQPKGVEVTATTDKKDLVKGIQDHFAQMGKGECPKHGKGDEKMGKGGCPHSKDKGTKEAPAEAPKK